MLSNFVHFHLKNIVKIYSNNLSSNFQIVILFYTNISIAYNDYSYCTYDISKFPNLVTGGIVIITVLYHSLSNRNIIFLIEMIHIHFCCL